MKTAVQLGYTGDRLEHIRLGGELHDIGKIGTREDILNKPGPLTPEEFEHIKEHAALGERILAPFLAESPMVLRIVRSHHERLDGGGFPDGLRGGADPVGGAHRGGGGRVRRDDHQPRLPGVPDAGGRGRTSCAAAPESHFDPEVVEAFLRAFPRRLGPADLHLTPARQPRPMSDTLMISVSGMRGHVGTDLTPELVARHAAALGAWVRASAAAAGAAGAPARPVVVLGRDARTSGPMFAHAAAAGLMSVGVRRHRPRASCRRRRCSWRWSTTTPAPA